MDTSQFRILTYQLAVLTSVLQALSGQLRMTPENVAAVVGAKVVLQCQGSKDIPDLGISWYKYTTPSSRLFISANGKITEGIPNYDRYSITGNSAVAQYHLNINLTFVSGSRYECFDAGGPFGASAHITVLQAAPVCRDTIQADGVVEEGETITYTCEAAYNSTSIDWPPVMSWTGPDVTITDVNKLSTSEGTVISSVDVTGAPGLNGAMYSVRTHFEAYGGSLPAEHATNVPTYSHTDNFNALKVYYKPRDIAFQPDGNTFKPGDRLTCSAVGNPDVIYRWYNSTDDNTLTDGAELIIREEMDGLTCCCEAYNTIRGTKHSINKEISLTVNKGEHDTTATEATTTTAGTCPAVSTCSGPSPGVIAGIVIAVILLLGTLVVSVVILRQIRRSPCKKCKEGSKLPQSTNLNISHGVYETPATSGTTQQPHEYAQLHFR